MADAEKTAPPPPETIYVAAHRIACDGGGGALGHPRVWYSLDDGEAECGYCDRKFIYDPAKAKAARQPGAN
ncbi:MAG: zinc-finger domain-containing protein [Parvularculaceae bacterium]